MLVITENQQGELERQHRAQLRAERVLGFSAWWAEHGKWLGNAAVPTLCGLLDAGDREAQAHGIDCDERLFLYLAARCLMPQMSGKQYFLVMDAVFADVPHEVRFDSICMISRAPHE